MCSFIKNIGKTFLAIPIAIYPFLACFQAEKNETAVIDILIYTIFGSVSDGDISSLVLCIENMVYILAFNVLFGTYISKHFSHMPSYNFSRITSRKKWFSKECMHLLGYAALYEFMFLSFTFWGCNFESAQKPNGDIIFYLVSIYVISVALIILTTLYINLAIIIWKTAVGFISCWLVTIVLLAIAKLTITNEYLTFINPMGFADFLSVSPQQVIAKMAYLMILVVVFIIGGNILVDRLDITLKEVD